MKKNFLNMLISLLILSVLLPSFAIAGPNENAGIRFDLDATTYGNQNLTTISNPVVGAYLRLDCYAINVHNLDTYELEVIYDSEIFEYVASSATNSLTYEENILTSEGGTAVGWMVDTLNLGVLSIAYTLTGTDTLEAPEGEGLIADIVFQVSSTIGDSLTFGTVNFYDTFGEVDLITDKDIAFIQGLVSVEPLHPDVEEETNLYQNYPNPFNGFTTISYSIKDMLRSEPVEVNIYNMLGQLVDTIEGRYGTATWNTANHYNGIYLYKLNTESCSEIRKMMVTK
ncbi:MAG: T9SS type A sorting domain-containing protein [Candidatus Celaenobacter antarcticus]|nr:T9SS type A sorting domain-containing protein [Candidatus Celaenobacter antarcticus]